MKAWQKALLLTASLFGSVNAIELELNGELTQGAILFGKVPPGSRVLFNDVELKLSDDGRFVFGIGRDAPLQVARDRARSAAAARSQHASIPG